MNFQPHLTVLLSTEQTSPAHQDLDMQLKVLEKAGERTLSYYYYFFVIDEVQRQWTADCPFMMKS